MATTWVRGRDPTFDNVWKVLYYPNNAIAKFSIVKDASGWWYLAPRRTARTIEDVGPFASMEAAAACFETIAGLD